MNTKALSAASLVAAPLLLLVGNAIDPGASDAAAERLPQIADHPARYVAAAYLLVLGALVFVPGLLALGNLLRGTPGRLGAGLVLTGTLTTIAFVGFGTSEYEAATSGLDAAQMARLADNVEASPVAAPLLIVFLVGVVIGSLVLAWALWRSRVVPGWAAGAIALGTVLNLAADRPALSALAFALQAVGYGRVGLRLASPLRLTTAPSTGPLAHG